MKTMSVFTLMSIITGVTFLPEKSFGKPFYSAYNLGISYATSTNYSAITYDTSKTATLPSDCEESPDDSSQMRCTAFLAPDGDGSFSVNLFVEKPFERQGLFYFKPGLTASTISYTGNLNPKPSSPFKSSSSSSNTSTSKGPTSTANTAPLDKASIEMYGINWQGYLRLGITPKYLPDLFIAGGVGLQTVVGKVKVFKTTTTTAVVQADGFAEGEIVVVRAGEGYLSGYASIDQSLATPFGTNLIEDNPSQTDTKNYRLGLKATQAGIRLLFPF